jgi:hypothetical protein
MGFASKSIEFQAKAAIATTVTRIGNPLFQNGKTAHVCENQFSFFALYPLQPFQTGRILISN